MYKIMEKIQNALNRNTHGREFGNANASLNKRTGKTVVVDKIYVDILYKKKGFIDSDKYESVTYGLTAPEASTSDEDHSCKNIEPIIWVEHAQDSYSEGSLENQIMEFGSNNKLTHCDSSDSVSESNKILTIKSDSGIASKSDRNEASRYSNSYTNSSGNHGSETYSQDALTSSESDGLELKLTEDARKLTLCKVYVEQKLNAYMENRKQILRCKEVISNKTERGVVFASYPNEATCWPERDENAVMSFEKGDFYVNKRNLVVDIKSNYNEETGETTREEVRKVIVVCSEVSYVESLKFVSDFVVKPLTNFCGINSVLEIDSNVRPEVENLSNFVTNISVTSQHPPDIYVQKINKGDMKYTALVEDVSRPNQSETNIIQSSDYDEKECMLIDCKELTNCSLKKISSAYNPEEMKRVELGWRNSGYLSRNNSSVFGTNLRENNIGKCCLGNCDTIRPTKKVPLKENVDYLIIEGGPQEKAELKPEDTRRTRTDYSSSSYKRTSIDTKIVNNTEISSSGNKVFNKIRIKVDKKVLTDKVYKETREGSRLDDFSKTRDNKGCGEVVKAANNKGLHGLNLSSNAQTEIIKDKLEIQQRMENGCKLIANENCKRFNQAVTVNITAIEANGKAKDQKVFEHVVKMKKCTHLKGLEMTRLLKTSSLRESVKMPKDTLRTDMSNARTNKKVKRFVKTGNVQLRSDGHFAQVQGTIGTEDQLNSNLRTIKPGEYKQIISARHTDTGALNEVDIFREQRECTSNKITRMELNKIVTPRAVTNYVTLEKEPMKLCKGNTYLPTIDFRRCEEFKRLENTSNSDAIIVNERMDILKYLPTDTVKKNTDCKGFENTDNCETTKAKESRDFLQDRKNVDQKEVIDSNNRKEHVMNIAVEKPSARKKLNVPEHKGIGNTSNVKSNRGLIERAMKQKRLARAVNERESVKVQKYKNGEILKIGTSKGFKGFVRNSYVETRNGIWQESLELKNVCVMQSHYDDTLRVDKDDSKDIIEVIYQNEEKHVGNNLVTSKEKEKDEENRDKNTGEKNKQEIKSVPNIEGDTIMYKDEVKVQDVYLCNSYKTTDTNGCKSNTIEVADTPELTVHTSELPATKNKPKQTIPTIGLVNVDPSIDLTAKQNRGKIKKISSSIPMNNQVPRKSTSGTTTDRLGLLLPDKCFKTIGATNRDSLNSELVGSNTKTEEPSGVPACVSSESNGISKNFQTYALAADLTLQPSILMQGGTIHSLQLSSLSTSKLLEEPISSNHSHENSDNLGQSLTEAIVAKHTNEDSPLPGKKVMRKIGNISDDLTINKSFSGTQMMRGRLMPSVLKNSDNNSQISRSNKNCDTVGLSKVRQGIKDMKCSERSGPTSDKPCFTNKKRAAKLEMTEKSTEIVAEADLLGKVKRKINFKRKYCLFKKNVHLAKPECKRSWKYLYLGHSSKQEQSETKVNGCEKIDNCMKETMENNPQTVLKVIDARENESTSVSLRNSNLTWNPVDQRMLLSNFETVCKEIDQKLVVYLTQLSELFPALEFKDLFDRKFNLLSLKELDVNTFTATSGVTKYPFQTENQVKEIGSVSNLDNRHFWENKFKVQGKLSSNLQNKVEQHQLCNQEHNNKCEKNETLNRTKFKTATSLVNLPARTGPNVNISTDKETRCVEENQTQCISTSLDEWRKRGAELANDRAAQQKQSIDILFFRKGGTFDNDEVSLITSDDWGETFSRCSDVWKFGRETLDIEQNLDGPETFLMNVQKRMLGNHTKEDSYQQGNTKDDEYENVTTKLRTNLCKTSLDMKRDDGVKMRTEKTHDKSSCKSFDNVMYTQTTEVQLGYTYVNELQASRTVKKVCEKLKEEQHLITEVEAENIIVECKADGVCTSYSVSGGKVTELDKRVKSKKIASAKPKKNKKLKLKFVKNYCTKTTSNVAEKVRMGCNMRNEKSKPTFKVNLIENKCKPKIGIKIKATGCYTMKDSAFNCQQDENVSCLWKNKSSMGEDEDSQYWEEFLSTMTTPETKYVSADCSEWDSLTFANINNTKKLTLEVIKGLGRRFSRDQEPSEYESCIDVTTYYSALTTTNTMMWQTALDAWSSDNVLSYEDALLSATKDADHAAEKFVSCTELHPGAMKTFPSHEVSCYCSSKAAFRNDSDDTNEIFQDARNCVP